MKKYNLVGFIPKDYGSGGGAWLGTLRLFKELDKSLGKNKVKLFVAIKNTKNTFVELLYPFSFSDISYYLMAGISKFINLIILKKVNTHFSSNIVPSLLDPIVKIKDKEAHNLYFHWVGNNFISLWLIIYITKRKNTLIKFADYWWLTGGCHYPDNCMQFKNSKCIDCPLVRKPFKFIPKYLFKIKRQIVNKRNIYIISPSKHLYKSTLNCLNNLNVFHIPNGLEISPYKERNFSNISIGIIAHGLQDKRKNIIQIKKIVNSLINEKSIVLNICGDCSKEIISSIKKPIKCKINNFGYIKNISKMKEFYFQSNHILFLSLADNSPNQILEAMSNGSIMISYKNSFSSEHIIDNLNGFLLSPKLSINNLHKEIIKIVNLENSIEISKEAFKYAFSKFTTSKMADAYWKLIDLK